MTEAEGQLCGIYEFINLITGKRYIGQTSVSFLRRYKEHLRELNRQKHHNRHFQNSFNKYKKEDCFLFQIIEVEVNRELLNKKESYYISLYKWEDTYNQTSGGDSNTSNILVNKEDLESLVIQKLSSNEIAEKLGCTQRQVFYWLKKYNLKIQRKLPVEDSKTTIPYQNIKKVNLESIKFPEYFLPELVETVANRNTELSFKLISPSGELVEGNNLNNFARDNRLDESTLHRVFKNLGNFQHMGWTNCYYHHLIWKYYKNVKIFNSIGERVFILEKEGIKKPLYCFNKSCFSKKYNISYKALNNCLKKEKNKVENFFVLGYCSFLEFLTNYQLSDQLKYPEL